jgi:uncharacterized membrane protein
MLELALAATAFVGTHLLLAHGLRGSVMRATGPKLFPAAYSLVAILTFIALVRAYSAAPLVQLWSAPGWAWTFAAALMLLAAILFVGSITPRNAALMGAPAATRPTGVLAITRHPMMWSFALWALAHALVAGHVASLILCAAIGSLALAGSALQDGKKEMQQGSAWRAYVGRTAFIPFARGMAFPGWWPLLGGLALWLGATHAHPYLGAPAVPPWTWLS